MKKTLAMLTSTLMAMTLLAGCTGGGTSSAAPVESTPAASVAASSAPAAESTPAATGEKYKVYLITMDQMDQHWVNVDAGAQKAVAELGNVEYRWFAPDVKDDAKQIEQINNAVADGAQAIMLAANGPTAVISALEDASAQGVKIVYVDSAADFAAAKTLATDNKAAGTTAGMEMLKQLETNGVAEGKIGIVTVNAATASTVAREEGFRAAFEGTAYEILETQYGEGDAAKSQQIAENYISQGVVAIFGANEGSTVGTGNAIKEDGNKIVGVGFDKTEAVVGLIKDGALLCTMAQNPDVMGYEGMKTAVGVLDGSVAADGAVIDTGVSVLNKDNV